MPATRWRSRATSPTATPIRRRAPRGSPWRCSIRESRRRPARRPARRRARRSSVADVAALEEFLALARVDDAVFALRPDYRGLLLAVDGLVPGASDDTGEELLQAAEAAAREALRDLPV